MGKESERDLPVTTGKECSMMTGTGVLVVSSEPSLLEFLQQNRSAKGY